MSENENPQPDMEQVYDQGGLAADGPLTGAVADEADTEAETIIPPEQPPMDDAAGGPQAADPNGPVDMPGENPTEGNDPQMPTEENDASRNSEAHPS